MLETIFKNPKEKTDFIISIVIVGLFGVGIIIGSFGNWDADELAQSFLTNDSKTEILKSESAPIAQTVTYDHGDASVEEDLGTDDIMIAPVAQDSSYVIAHTSQVSEEITTTTEEDEMVISPSSPDIEASMDTIVTQAEETSAVSIGAEVDDNAIAESVDSSTKTEKTLVVPSEPDPSVQAEEVKEDLNCQIVVGAYSSKENRARKLDELLKDNYVTYTYKQRGLYVASIKVSCDEEVRKTILKEIRKKHAAGAFIPRK